VADTAIENPIVNSPFSEPSRHFSDDGITNEVVEGRRSSAYLVPIAKPKKKGKQLVFAVEAPARLTLSAHSRSPETAPSPPGGHRRSRGEHVGLGEAFGVFRMRYLSFVPCPLQGGRASSSTTRATAGIRLEQTTNDKQPGTNPLGVEEEDVGCHALSAAETTQPAATDISQEVT
jgi:hypothetical protein